MSHDHDFAIGRRNLLGAGLTLAAGLGLSSLARASEPGAGAASGEDTAIPSLAGKRIAISTVGTSIYFDSRGFKVQVEAVKRLRGDA